ncbi:MAG: ABC transporter permease [Solirubrobacterales bacterium]
MSAPPASLTDRSSRPSLATLAVVEGRKMLDTRAGLWLLILTALAAVGGTLGQSLGNSHSQAGEVFFTAVQAVSLLLPVVGILLVTSEWSQRTGLVTFVLVPVRWRIVVAKMIAATVIALAAALICLALGLLGGTLLGGGNEITAVGITRGSLFLVIAVLIGVGLGLAFQNSPFAIVFNFVGPLLISAIGAISSSINDVTVWLDQSILPSLPDNADLSSEEWRKVAVTVLVWAAIPLLAGALRLRREDID